MRSTLSVISLLLLAGCQREAPAPSDVTTAAPAVESNAPVSRPQTPAPQPAGAIAADAVPSALCNLEGVGDASFSGETLVVNSSAPALLRGWVGLESTKTAPASTIVRIEAVSDFAKAWEVALPVGESREDVAAANSSPGLSNAGFSGAVDLSALPADTYRVYVRFEGDDTHYFCDNGRQVQLTQQ